MLVVADVVVAAAAGPALATAANAGNGDLVAWLERLNHTGSDCDDFARKLVPADQRIRPVVDPSEDALLPRAQRCRRNPHQYLPRPRLGHRQVLEFDVLWADDDRAAIRRLRVISPPAVVPLSTVYRLALGSVMARRLNRGCRRPWHCARHDRRLAKNIQGAVPASSAVAGSGTPR